MIREHFCGILDLLGALRRSFTKGFSKSGKTEKDVSMNY